MTAAKILVGRISGAHGVRGLVKVHSFTDPPQAFAEYASLLDETGRPVEIEIKSTVKGQFLAAVSGIADRDAAEKARGQSLYISHDQLSPAEADEFYHADLIGAEARSASGEVLGTVKSVENYGANDILDIKGTGRRDFMVPFTDAFVPEVDVEAGYVVIADFGVIE